MPWWYTPDVSGWSKSAEEPVGLRAKHWVTDESGTEWLRKQPRDSRPYELAIEAFTLELARRCGYPVAHGTCCTWQENGETKRGFVSRKFQDSLESQASGGELVAPLIHLGNNLLPRDQEQQRRVQTTLAVVRTALEQQENRYGVKLLEPFIRMLVFDAWIGNGDRHSANWAILVRSQLHGSACRLAPMYDTAACLLAELKDETIELRYPQGKEDAAIARYIAKCGSGFGDGTSNAGVSHEKLLEDLRQWPEWRDCAPGLISFFSNNLTMIGGVLDEIPADWLPLRRKQLIARLLEGRVKMLQGLQS